MSPGWPTPLESAGWRSPRTPIRRRPVERAAIREHSARCFYFTRADLLAAESAARFLHNLVAVERACTEPGPFAYAIHAKRILQMPL
jgi:hypothetical protein